MFSTIIGLELYETLFIKNAYPQSTLKLISSPFEPPSIIESSPYLPCINLSLLFIFIWFKYLLSLRLYEGYYAWEGVRDLFWDNSLENLLLFVIGVYMKDCWIFENLGTL
jgi:hypothetical protein